MHRSSESIASLAAALAKAQSELVNPEKSLIGSVKRAADDDAERLFRYALLASGLEIVRKTLGQHEIATVQTTALDQSAGTVNLTTVLAHASGQWISSDWPICAIADSAEPHRMGAALTYARRYALFTLVGIAGEDDLDAPGLLTPTQKASAPQKPSGNRRGQLRSIERGLLKFFEVFATFVHALLSNKFSIRQTQGLQLIQRSRHEHSDASWTRVKKPPDKVAQPCSILLPAKKEPRLAHKFVEYDTNSSASRRNSVLKGLDAQWSTVPPAAVTRQKGRRLTRNTASNTKIRRSSRHNLVEKSSPMKSLTFKGGNGE